MARGALLLAPVRGAHDSLHSDARLQLEANLARVEGRSDRLRRGHRMPQQSGTHVAMARPMARAIRCPPLLSLPAAGIWRSSSALRHMLDTGVQPKKIFGTRFTMLRHSWEANTILC